MSSAIAVAAFASLRRSATVGLRPSCAFMANAISHRETAAFAAHTPSSSAHPAPLSPSCHARRSSSSLRTTSSASAIAFFATAYAAAARRPRGDRATSTSVGSRLCFFSKYSSQ